MIDGGCSLLEDDKPITTRCDLPIKYGLNQSSRPTVLPIPNHRNSVFGSMPMSIVSNDALLSNRTSTTQCPESRFCARNFMLNFHHDCISRVLLFLS